MMTLYIIEKVNSDKTNQSGERLVVTDKHHIQHHSFERLGDVLYRIGYQYIRDYTAVEIYKNSSNKNIGDIISNEDGSLPEPFKIYHSDVGIGEYYDGMLIRFIME